MSRVNSIQNEKNNSMLTSVAKAMAAGGVAGYAAKYGLGLNKYEREDRDYVRAMEIAKKSAQEKKADIIDSIRNLKKRSLAQDTFIKMVDVQAETPKAKIKEMWKHAAKLKGSDREELSFIIDSTRDYASQMAKRYKKFYEAGVKSIRSKGEFIVPGVIAGFLAGVAYNIMKSPVEDA